MVACETPVLHTKTAQPAILVRDKLRVLSHEKQKSIVAWAQLLVWVLCFNANPAQKVVKQLLDMTPAGKPLRISRSHPCLATMPLCPPTSLYS